MKKGIEVSIIIPSYKPESYLWDCLGSFWEQTFPKENFEVILVLNGCNEPYSTQIRQWIKSHESLNVLFEQTDARGVSNARNIGLDKAHGEYIGFVDDDDFVSPGYIETLYKEANPETIPLAYAISFFDNDKERLVPYRKTECYEKRYQFGKQSYNYASTFFSGPVYKLIHKDIIENRRFDSRFVNGEDTIFNFEISDRFRYVIFTTKDATYYWRRRTNSAQSNLSTFNARFDRMIKMICKMLGIYLPHFWKYNFIFFVTRVLSTVKSLFIKH